MVTITHVEKLALDLPQSERVKLIAYLLDTLPPVLSDEDDGVSEALRRDEGMNAEACRGLSFEEFEAKVRARRG